MLRHFGLVLLVALSLTSAGAVQAAEPAPEDTSSARATFNEGAQLYTIGEYRAALAAFKRSYLTFPAPDTLFNIAQCHRRLGDHAEAARLYRNYLDLVPKLAAAERSEVERLLLEEERAAVAVESSRRSVEATPAGTAVASPATVSAPPRPKPRRLWIVGVVVGVVAAAGVAVGVGVGISAAGGASDPVSTLGGIRF